jgi:16S rRNA (guanine966-N2)-methyltransferase
MSNQLAKSSPGEVRIIGGQWKRSKLPVASKPGLRPTPDRVRETLFNWLGHNLSGWRCLDAFAGTGALGFEAASRGAAQVLCVEQDRSLIEQLQKNRAKLQADALEIKFGDGLNLLRQSSGLQVVFLDPPFDSGNDFFLAAVEAAARAIADDGFIYLEAPRAWTDDELAPLGLRVHRTLKAGLVHAHLLQKVVLA